MKMVEQNHLQLKLQERRENGKIFFKLRNSFFLIKQCLNNISGILEGAFLLVMNRGALGSCRQFWLQALAAGALLAQEGRAKFIQHYDAMPPGTVENEWERPRSCRNPPLRTKLRAPLDPNTITDVHTEMASLQTFW